MMQARDFHRKIEKEFLSYIGANTPLILKGGTALMLCYGLNRFSEDLDFDASYQGFSSLKFVKQFCGIYGYRFIEKKNTRVVQRAMIHYGGMQPLKIETSFRRKTVPEAETTLVNNIHVYKMEYLASMKINAYLARDKIRDLYDVSFIVNNYWEDLSAPVQSTIRFALAEKGLEQFDIVIKEQKDELIDPVKLEDEFLKAMEKADLATPPTTRNDLKELINTQVQKLKTDYELKQDSEEYLKEKHKR